MSLFRNAAVCDEVDSNLCDAVFEVTGNESAAVASGWLVAKPLEILGLVLLAVVGRWLLHRVIDRLANRAAEGRMSSPISRGRLGRASERLVVAGAAAAERRTQRIKAMASLLKSIVTGVVVVLVAIMVIAELGYDPAPLIASAGVVGVALGFGAQSLVKDFLSGIFMIFEDQYGVGDVVDAGEAIGTVEAVSLRVTRLRDVNGTVWYVRNGEILRIGNMSQNWARTVLDIPVAYGEDLHRVQEVLRDVAHSLWEDEEYRSVIIEEPEIWGVEMLTPDGVVVRVTLKTAPLEQWEVAREMRQRIKARFDHEGIEIALPQRVIWHRDAPGATATSADAPSEPNA
ncbi:MAG: Potassium efflux system KefA protein / Small-conductance mechanosensitive channel [uncultured Nocardioidaceae bacterium]|uniref:Potassium efflux system KefA protein / Small-conductance mechanosensitive channel n=1 Tax=uncultured Nocardioidaceae bacterium TaxID=253824 RepID=A0A6J4LQ63_9ACTN|nr:MAG: Potassium efflux system KefA protein / Small-conductance mechanosensitive channel [uncultured Nocardioidaceae bacterium]